MSPGLLASVCDPPPPPPPPAQALLLPLIQSLTPELAEAYLFFSAPELVSAMVSRVEGIRLLAQQDQREAEAARRSREDCERRLGALRDRLLQQEQTEQEMDALKAEVMKCRRHPLVIQVPHQTDQLPTQTAWMLDWRQSPGFEKQAAILRLVGETGLGRVPKIRERVADFFGYQNPHAGAITQAFAALQKRSFLGMRRAEGGMQGRPPQLVWLTDLGQAAFVMLTGASPLASELDSLAAHVSDPHMLLNLEAQDWLQKDGYQVLAHGYRHYLGGVRQAVPDLTVQKEGQVFYIEVERSGKKSERPEKWWNLRELSGGELYIFCQYPRSQEQIGEEARQALAQKSLSCRLHLTNLADLREGFRGEDGGLWLKEFQCGGDFSPGCGWGRD